MGGGKAVCSAGRSGVLVPIWVVLLLAVKSLGLLLFRLSDLQLHKIIGPNYSQDSAHGQWKLLPAGIVDDCWIGEPVLAAASLKLASAGGEDIFDPLALAPIGERDCESVGGMKNIYWCSIDLA